jgi:hypothetical protein
VHEVRITVVAPNRDAQRLYERRGLEPVALTLAAARPRR